MSIRTEAEQDLSRRLTRALSRALERAEGNTPKAEARRSADKAPKLPENVVELRPGITSETKGGGQEIWPLPGLAPMTRVRTSFGDVHSIALRKGDEVLTRSGKYLPILWIKRIRLDEHILSTKPDSNPVVIAPGALGNTGELMISPRQIIGADDTNGLRSDREAAMLISQVGVRRLRESGLTYTMFHLGEDAEVMCEGLFLSFPMEA